MALNEFVQTALDEEGYEEGSNGYTKYGSWYGLANADWCVNMWVQRTLRLVKKSIRFL